MRKTTSQRMRGMAFLQILWQLLPSVLLGVLFTAVGVLHVTSRICVVDIGYRFSSVESEIRTLVHQNDQLKVEMATLKSPARLEKIAREKLGMVAPNAGAVWTIGPPTKVARSPQLVNPPGPGRASKTFANVNGLP
jgi:cell division protein FtsL